MKPYHWVMGALWLAAQAMAWAEGGALTLRKGDYEVAVSESGSHSVLFAGETIVKYEALQLIDKKAGWRSVFGYGQKGEPSREVAEEAGASVCRVSQDVAGVISYRKQVSVGAEGVSWVVEYEAPPKTGTQDNYYFLDMPMELLSEALVRKEALDGDKVQVVDTDVSESAGLSNLRSITFTTARWRISFALGGEGVQWMFTDWTATVHRSYRLRIERPCEEGVKARIEVKMSVEQSTPERLAREKDELRKAAEMKRRKRMAESGLVCEKKLKLGQIEQNRPTVGRGEKFELTFDLEAAFDNPFEPEEIDVTCEFRSPSGKAITIPGFFYQDFRRRAERGTGYEAVGAPVWKVRFAPREAGKYEYRISAQDRNGKVESDPGYFECGESKTKGYIRVGRKNPYYFEFESGASYLPIGFNLFINTRLGAPIPPDRLDLCEQYMNRLADHGGNFVRLRMDSWWNAIEMTPDEATGYLGLGYYHQDACWEVDQIYELAERRGIYIMHCLDNANANVNLRPNNPRNAWRAAYDVYLKENGGVCESHQDFWTNKEVERFVQNKLRYVVARWGWSANCMCWEFWNEVALRKDIIDDAATWHQSTARFLRGIDPYSHPITTSLMGDHSLLPRIFGLPEMEINQLHSYSGEDVAEATRKMCVSATDSFPKPFFVGEYGVPPEFARTARDWDGEGLHVHNGLWAPMFSRGAGAGAFWYIQYLDEYNLYVHYKPFADFVNKIPWNDPDLQVMPLAAARWEKLPGNLHYVDFRIPTSQKWAMQAAPLSTFEIRDDGTVENGEMIQAALHRSPERGKFPTFQVDFGEPGAFAVYVKMSVGNEENALVIFLDGQKAVDKPFPAGKGLGLASEYVEKYGNYRTAYDETVTVDVPAGKHEIRVEMRGKDRLEVAYSLKNYLCFEKSHPLRIFGLKTGQSAHLWIQNRLSTWPCKHSNTAPIPVEGMLADIAGLEDGAYTIEWWDTWKGGALGEKQIAQARDGKLTIVLPRVERDVACWILSGDK